jgi:hypothetical protein
LDIRIIFKELSEQLLSEFRKSAVVTHSGGKGDIREDAFRDFLRDHLPTRYAVGKGEVITPDNRVSPELDIVIYDPQHCPALIKSTSHSVYPIESVFGAISMKSHLDSGKLTEAYNNIVSFKAILLKTGFMHHDAPGFSVGLANPIPVTGIVAYDSNRSLDAIAAQVERLDGNCTDIQLRPDFIAVIGQGIIAPRTPLRGTFNSYTLPNDLKTLVELRKTGRHTLLRLYMELLRELNALTLRPLDLRAYDDMPVLVGSYRVGGRTRFVKVALDASEQARSCRLNEAGITEIVNSSKPVTWAQHLLNTLGRVPEGYQHLSVELAATIYEYNPHNQPPLSNNSIKITADGQARVDIPFFQAVGVTIDGKSYAVDFVALNDSHFSDDPDFTVDELMSS